MTVTTIRTLESLRLHLQGASSLNIPRSRRTSARSIRSKKKATPRALAGHSAHELVILPTHDLSPLSRAVGDRRQAVRGFGLAAVEVSGSMLV